ncbi:hypothetical protein KAW18_02455 [candidate division WOR-3 bacterium]|nr:hypothetical protein [candidate division WOR-3 bacterium]
MKIKKQQNLDDKFTKETAKIKCEICGKEFEKITSTHLKMHDITMLEYREKFPNASLASDGYRKKISEALTDKEPTSKMIEGHKRAPEKISKTLTGRHLTDEHKQHISDNHADQSGEKSGMWKGGISNLPYCEKFDDDLKERVRNFFGRCCYVCGMNETDNGRKLDVHHVNYNKMVCCNDVKPLFVPLCRSCHGKTQKDREYWEEFFTVSINYLTNGECFTKKEKEK